MYYYCCLVAISNITLCMSHVYNFSFYSFKFLYHIALSPFTMGHKKTADGPIKHSSFRTKLHTCLPWKQWTKYKTIKWTNGKKKVHSHQAAEHKLDYNTTITDAWQRIYEEAVALYAKFGVHSVKWYHKDLLQVSSKKAKHNISEWNIFTMNQSSLMVVSLIGSYCTYDIYRPDREEAHL